jgi:hypothetical protein
MKTPGPTAWEAVIRNPSQRWGHNLEAFDRAAYPVAYTPKFPVGMGQRYFCMGSCFARHIELHLIYRDVLVLSKCVKSPKEEWSTRPNGIVNKYTTHSMLNEVRWLESPIPADKKYYVPFDSGWLDPQLASGAKPVSLERAIERRRYLMADYFSRLSSADVVVLTLGLNEVWSDAETGLRLNVAPTLKAVREQPDRYSLEVTSVGQNLEALEELRQRLLRLRPGLKIIVTVSPVPLELSFTGQDAVTANTRSKAVLRVAAEEFAHANPDVDYFPSYEMITAAPSGKAYLQDHVHVTDCAVGDVVGMFLKSHGIDWVASDFREGTYLEANPDVERLVREGELISGFHHWRSHGQKEGRPLRLHASSRPPG